MDQKQKLSIVRDFGSIQGVAAADGWKSIRPNEHNDWLSQRDSGFGEFITFGDKKNKEQQAVFKSYSSGLKTNRDSWCYNFSKHDLANNMRKTIDFYNSVAQQKDFSGTEKTTDNLPISLLDISWSWVLRLNAVRGKPTEFSRDALAKAIHRPFTKTWLYYDPMMNENRYLMPQIFPGSTSSNLHIMVKQRWNGDGHLALMTDAIADIHSDGGIQCFPLKLYFAQVDADEEEVDLFSGEPTGNSIDGITDAGLKHFQDAYPGETITKEDLFYFVYGLLHSEDYRAKYADNLSKELPRIPRVKTAADFWAFSRAGRELGDLHVNYETVEPYPVTIKQGDLRLADIKNPEAFYRVTKWAFGKAGKEKDKTTVIYNTNITMQDVPLEAYDYVVNGKPALEWVMERQVVKTDKDSGIENDANRYAIETMGNPAYPLELFQRVITVSLRTMEIVRGLPKLEVV